MVEEKSTGAFAGRAGPWFPPSWPGFEVGWGIAGDFRGKGYAVEAASAAIDWSFATFEIDRIKKCCTHYALPDGRLMPGCAYNLLYRDKDPRYVGPVGDAQIWGKGQA